MRRLRSKHDGVSRCGGIALLESIVSLTIFLILLGSVTYASRMALSVMSESMRETRLLFRVRRALDHAEEQLSRCTSVSVVALTENGWTIAGLGNWFEQLAQQNEGAPLGADAEEVQTDLESSRVALEGMPPDFDGAVEHLTSAIRKFREMLDAGSIDPVDGETLREALTELRLDVLAHNVFSIIGGQGTGAPNAWQEIEQTITDHENLVAAEPLIATDHVLFRQILSSAPPPTFHPPLDQPPASYYLRPVANSSLFELMYYDGDRSIVVAEDLTGVRFERDHDSIKITLLLEEEQDGVMIERTEVRTVLLHIE